MVVASTNASLFAYVADGRNGIKVLQLTSPSSQPNFYGFSPRPVPELISWARTPSPALALSKGLDRDRAVDETGGQIAVFGRLGSRPFNRTEMQRMYLNSRGLPYQVQDEGSMQDWMPAPGGGAVACSPIRRKRGSCVWSRRVMARGHLQPSPERIERQALVYPSAPPSASGPAAGAGPCSSPALRHPRR